MAFLDVSFSWYCWSNYSILLNFFWEFRLFRQIWLLLWTHNLFFLLLNMLLLLDGFWLFLFSWLFFLLLPTIIIFIIVFILLFMLFLLFRLFMLFMMLSFKRFILYNFYFLFFFSFALQGALVDNNFIWPCWSGFSSVIRWLLLELLSLFLVMVIYLLLFSNCLSCMLLHVVLLMLSLMLLFFLALVYTTFYWFFSFYWLGDAHFEICGIKVIKHCLILHQLDLQILVSFIMISYEVIDSFK